MGKISGELRRIIAANIRAQRVEKYPGRGGGKKCAEAFGVSPQQWSPWERGRRTPDELRLSQIAEFFGMSVEWMRSDHRQRRIAGANSMPPSCNPVKPAAEPASPASPGSAASFFWLAHNFVMSVEKTGLRLDRKSLEYLAQCIKRS